MAIDKILPGRLDADSDERLLENGYMSDAMNVTLSEDGKGTASIVKNIKGTIKADPLNDSDNPVNNKRVRGIGSASDSQRGFVYFIVADTEDDGDEDAIYQYNVATDKYRLVLKDKRFKFDHRGFAKIDVVNGDFARNGGLQTILFFTDGINPPRKINVDRAFAGEYSDISDRDFEYALNSIKAANVFAPTAQFVTDQTIDTNLFREESFQFATQLIYKDGEESAISPYSNLTIPTQLTVYNVNEEGFGLGYNVDNVCVVNPNISAPDLKSSPDILKVRILFRSGNNGPFLVADEVPVNTPTTRSINGIPVQIFDGDNSYRFYNDRLAVAVPDLETNKLYDNVPFQATGQAVCGNRLMYSNYTEFRPNVNASASLKTVYNKSGLTRVQLVDQSDSNGDGQADVLAFNVLPQFGSTGMNIDLRDIFGLDEDSASDFVVDAGTVVDFSFTFAPLTTGQSFELSHQYSFDNDGTSGGPQSVSINNVTIQAVDTLAELNDGVQGGLLFVDPNEPQLPEFSLSFVTPFDMPFTSSDEDEANFVDFFISQLSSQSIVVPYYATFSGSVTFSSGDIESFSDEPLVYSGFETGAFVGVTDFVFRFDEFEVNSNQVISVQLDVNSGFAHQQTENVAIRVDNPAFDGPGSGEPEIPVAFQSPFDILIPSPLNVSSGAVFNEESEAFEISGTYINDKKFSAVSRSQASGFKAGALHNLGVVYYDKYNRSGFVNELGTFYVEWFNKDGDDFRGDRFDPDNYADGPASVEIEFPISSEPPEWAETFQIVYPGNSSVSEFVQYTVGGAYPARVKHPEVDGEISPTNLANRDIDTQSKRLYISLETLDQYREDKNTFRDYSYTEGDRLRVISYRAEIGSGGVDTDTTEEQLENIYKGASDGTIAEFEVVGVEVLERDVHNPIAYQEVGDTLENLNKIPAHMTGKFLVIEASSIAGGAFGEDGNILRFPGFDWNHVSRSLRSTTATQLQGGANEDDFNYVGVEGEVPSATNAWRNQCVVEIFTPKKSIENDFYFEIDKPRPIVTPQPDRIPSIGAHGPAFTVSTGDINYRPVPCKAPKFDEDADDQSNVFRKDHDLYEYRIQELEDFTVSEKIGEKMWSKGRPHVKFENAATFRRFNGVTYSDAFAEDAEKLALASFNPGTANFYSLDSQYGACNYISNYGTEQQGYDELVSIQENKFSKTPVNKSIITDAAGSTNVALTTDVLRTTTYYAGDYGCGNHPESVLVQDNDVYFFDRSRHKVLRFAGGQLTAISDQGVSSLVDDAVELFNKIYDRNSGRIVSGYDPDDQVYYITFVPAQQLGYQSGAVIEDDQDGGDEDAGGSATGNLPVLVPLYFNPDLDGSGAIGTPEILNLLGAFGTNVDSSFPVYESDDNNNFTQTLLSSPDFDFDGQVGVPDLLLLLGAFGSALNAFEQNVDEDVYIADGLSQLIFNGQPLFFDVENQVVAYEDGTPVNDSGSFLTEETTGNALRNLNLLGDDLAADAIEFLAEEGYIGFTISYNSAGRFWQSRNSFYPDVYANQDNSMYTVKYVNDDTFPDLPIGFPLLMHKHADNDAENNRCQFYNQNTSQSFIEVVSNTQPSTVKVYDAVSQEVTNGVMNCSIESSDGSRSIIGVQKFSEREGTFYAQVGRDISPNSTSHIRLLGLVSETVQIDDDFFLRLSDFPNGIMEGAKLRRFVDGILQNIGSGDTIVTVGNSVLSDPQGPLVKISGNTVPLAGQAVVMVLPKDLNGDSVRGHFTKIKMSSTNNNKYELFCVNAHYTPSNLNHV